MEVNVFEYFSRVILVDNKVCGLIEDMIDYEIRGLNILEIIY